jgi:hypothetical protein
VATYKHPLYILYLFQFFLNIFAGKKLKIYPITHNSDLHSTIIALIDDQPVSSRHTKEPYHSYVQQLDIYEMTDDLNKFDDNIKCIRKYRYST